MLTKLQLSQVKMQAPPALAAVIQILDQNAAVAANPGNLALVQTALDALLPDDALISKASIEVLVKAQPSLCYTGVKTFRTNECQPRAARFFAGNWAKYSSNGFHVAAEVYCIAAATSPWELGFIQHCTAKTDYSTFSDGSRMEGRSMTLMPVGDSSGTASEPFYHKGISYMMTDPAWIALAGKATNSYKLEMSDEFNNNGHPKRSFGPGGNLTNGVIQQIRRRQSFTCWLARRNALGQELLLREVSYTISVDSDYQIVGNSLMLGAFLSRCAINTQKIPVLNAARPNVAVYTMNGTERWWYTANGGMAVNTNINY